MLALRNSPFGMEPARRFAPRTWLLRSPAATGRSRARVSITRLFTSSRVAYAATVLPRILGQTKPAAGWPNGPGRGPPRSFTSPSDQCCCAGRLLDHPQGRDILHGKEPKPQTHPFAIRHPSRDADYVVKVTGTIVIRQQKNLSPWSFRSRLLDGNQLRGIKMNCVRWLEV